MRPILSLALLLLPLCALGQTLGEVAEKEKARRKQLESKEKSPAYSNESLPEAGKKTSENKTSAPSTSAPPPAPSNRASEESTWKQRAGAVRNALKAAQQKVADLETKDTQLGTQRLLSTDTNQILRLSVEQKAVKDQLEAAKGEVVAAQKALEDFEESARRQSIPPGWLEPPPS